MANTHAFIYDVPTDKVTGTWSKTGGTVNALYPLTNIDDGKPWNPVKFTVNPTRLSIDHSSAVALAGVSFIHCNFPAGYAPVVARGSSLGTPLTTVTVTCPGPAEDNQPSNPFVDMTALAGVGNYRFTWIDLPATGTLLSLGLIRLTATKRQIAGFASTGVRNRDWGGYETEVHPLIERRTDAGTQVGYGRGTRARTVHGSVRCIDAGYANLQSWTRATQGRLSPCLLIPDPTVNEALWVRWGASADAILKRTTFGPSAYDVPVDWEELGRGLAP